MAELDEIFKRLAEDPDQDLNEIIGNKEEEVEEEVEEVEEEIPTLHAIPSCISLGRYTGKHSQQGSGILKSKSSDLHHSGENLKVSWNEMPDVAPPVVSNADDTPLKDKEGDVSSVDDTPLKAMEPLKAKDTIPVKAEPELMNTKQHAFNQRKETQEVPNPRLQRSHATSQGNLLKDSPKPARQLKSAVSHSTLAPIKPSGGSKMGSPNPEKRDMGHLQRPTSSQLKKANSSTLLPSIGKTSRPNSALSVEEDPETRTKREVAEYLDHLRLTMDPKYGSPRGYKNIKGSQLDLRKTHQSNSRLHSLEK